MLRHGGNAIAQRCVVSHSSAERIERDRKCTNSGSNNDNDKSCIHIKSGRSRMKWVNFRPPKDGAKAPPLLAIHWRGVALCTASERNCRSNARAAK